MKMKNLLIGCLALTGFPALAGGGAHSFLQLGGLYYFNESSEVEIGDSKTVRKVTSSGTKTQEGKISFGHFTESWGITTDINALAEDPYKEAGFIGHYAIANHLYLSAGFEFTAYTSEEKTGSLVSDTSDKKLTNITAGVTYYTHSDSSSIYADFLLKNHSSSKLRKTDNGNYYKPLKQLMVEFSGTYYHSLSEDMSIGSGLSVLVGLSTEGNIVTYTGTNATEVKTKVKGKSSLTYKIKFLKFKAYI